MKKGVTMQIISLCFSINKTLDCIKSSCAVAPRGLRKLRTAPVYLGTGDLYRRCLLRFVSSGYIYGVC